MLSFLSQQVYSKKSSIRGTIPKNKMINFSNDYAQQVSGRIREKVSQMEKDGLISIFSIAEESNLIVLVELFHNRVTYGCLVAFNFDGSIRNTQKSKALEKCNMFLTTNRPREYVSLVNMGFIWRLATPTPANR